MVNLIYDLFSTASTAPTVLRATHGHSTFKIACFSSEN